MQHAHDFRAFLVDSQRIKVRDIDEGVRAHRMRQRTGVFCELVRPEKQGILNALHTTRIHVGREFAIAKYGKTLFQTELKPIATGDTVPRIIVEILVCHHRLDPLKSHVGSDVRVGQHAGGIENVEALVLHRAHVEIIHGNDVV